MKKHIECYSYRINWLIFKTLWGLIFISLKMLFLINQLALHLG